MPAFLLKTEPSEYAFSDLVRDNRCTWTGVKNPAALIHMRTMCLGDDVFIYHTGNEKQIVGIATVCKAPYQDPEFPGLNDRGEPKRPVIDLEPLRSVNSPMKLAMFKSDARLRDCPLLGFSRLSVMPIAAAHARIIRSVTGL